MDEQDIFIDIGQTTEDLETDLTDLDLGSDVFDVREQKGFTYPAMLITGVKFNDTLRILQSVYRESHRLFDVWIDLQDGSPPVKQGTLPADSTVFLTMRYLGLGVTLYLTEDQVWPLDLNDPEVIEKFI